MAAAPRYDQDVDPLEQAKEIKRRLAQVKVETPCDRCPKMKLHPGVTFGLHPANVLAVRLYYQVARERRVGDMGGIYLLHTVTAEDAEAVLRVNEHEFGSWLARRNTFDKIMLIDELATARRNEMEKEERARVREEMERSHKR